VREDNRRTATFRRRLFRMLLKEGVVSPPWGWRAQEVSAPRVGAPALAVHCLIEVRRIGGAPGRRSRSLSLFRNFGSASVVAALDVEVVGRHEAPGSCAHGRVMLMYALAKEGRASRCSPPLRFTSASAEINMPPVPQLGRRCSRLLGSKHPHMRWTTVRLW